MSQIPSASNSMGEAQPLEQTSQRLLLREKNKCHLFFCDEITGQPSFRSADPNPILKGPFFSSGEKAYLGVRVGFSPANLFTENHAFSSTRVLHELLVTERGKGCRLRVGWESLSMVNLVVPAFHF